MTDPSTARAPGDSLGGDELLARISTAGHDIAGVSDGPLAEAVTRLDALHRELQGALAELDQA